MQTICYRAFLPPSASSLYRRIFWGMSKKEKRKAADLLGPELNRQYLHQYWPRWSILCLHYLIKYTANGEQMRTLYRAFPTCFCSFTLLFHFLGEWIRGDQKKLRETIHGLSLSWTGNISIFTHMHIKWMTAGKKKKREKSYGSGLSQTGIIYIISGGIPVSWFGILPTFSLNFNPGHPGLSQATRLANINIFAIQDKTTHTE
jgi:hypothetical protein